MFGFEQENIKLVEQPRATRTLTKKIRAGIGFGVGNFPFPAEGRAPRAEDVFWFGCGKRASSLAKSAKNLPSAVDFIEESIPLPAPVTARRGVSRTLAAN